MVALEASWDQELSVGHLRRCVTLQLAVGFGE